MPPPPQRPRVAALLAALAVLAAGLALQSGRAARVRGRQLPFGAAAPASTVLEPSLWAAAPPRPPALATPPPAGLGGPPALAREVALLPRGGEQRPHDGDPPPFGGRNDAIQAQALATKLVGLLAFAKRQQYTWQCRVVCLAEIHDLAVYLQHLDARTRLRWAGRDPHRYWDMVGAALAQLCQRRDMVATWNFYMRSDGDINLGDSDQHGRASAAASGIPPTSGATPGQRSDGNADIGGGGQDSWTFAAASAFPPTLAATPGHWSNGNDVLVDGGEHGRASAAMSGIPPTSAATLGGQAPGSRASAASDDVGDNESSTHAPAPAQARPPRRRTTVIGLDMFDSGRGTMEALVCRSIVDFGAEALSRGGGDGLASAADASPGDFAASYSGTVFTSLESPAVRAAAAVALIAVADGMSDAAFARAVEALETVDVHALRCCTPTLLGSRMDAEVVDMTQGVLLALAMSRGDMLQHVRRILVFRRICETVVVRRGAPNRLRRHLFGRLMDALESEALAPFAMSRRRLARSLAVMAPRLRYAAADRQWWEQQLDRCRSRFEALPGLKSSKGERQAIKRLIKEFRDRLRYGDD